jgi:hypothetical protein
LARLSTGVSPEAQVILGERAKLATLFFLIALLLGNVALIGGLVNEGGMSCACAFAVACLLWWIAYRISRSVSGRGMNLGFVALGLWMLNLIGALVFYFHHSVGAPFFWSSTVLFLLLITAFALSDARLNPSKSFMKSK